MEEKTRFGDRVAAGLEAGGQIDAALRIAGRFRMECVGADGKVKWVEEFDNLVVNVGLDDALDKYFKGAAYTATHYIGLKGTGAAAAGDTMASHAGWVTITPYSEATDPAFTPGAVAGQSVDNSASKASFSINATDTIFGAFLKTDNTKGGAIGTLYSAGDFAASRAVVSGDTLNVTYTATAS